VTPRRLAIVVEDLPPAQPDLTEEKKGPRVDAPETAIAGFLRSVGLASVEACEQREIGKNRFLFAVQHRPGRPTAEVLPEVIAAVAQEMHWPKSMRWGVNSFRWVRPLHSVLAVFDGKPLKGRLSMGSAATLDFTDRTVGHLFRRPTNFTVRRFADYESGLRDHYVVLGRNQRRDMIWSDACLAAEQRGLQVRPDPGLLDEVAGLVEWPVVLIGAIDAPFMELPPEVLTTSMRSHQKYFSLQRSDGSLAPHFVVVANMLAEDGGKAIVAGNERVLRARLADARFFWDQDRKHALADRVTDLANRIFHAKLGSVLDKVDRVEVLCGAEIARRVVALAGLGGAAADALIAEARRAARLAKADLATGMVGEFPELQGTMGRYYALADGEPLSVAEAIADHYAPLGPDDRCPSRPASLILALADKIDTLTGFFKVGEKPTGSKDPFALRRAALGVIRIVIESRLRLPLRAVFAEALLSHGVIQEDAVTQLANELLEFFIDRLKVYFRDRGLAHDHIAAVFALGEDDIVLLQARAEALKEFLASDDGINLLTAYRRAGNIVAIEEKRDGIKFEGEADHALLKVDEEQRLARALTEVQQGTRTALGLESFRDAMQALALLRQPVDAFFDRVTVNCEDADLRVNRLRLLSQIRATLGQVADFSKIEG
jgi:glycyl-tRNA synthetase beta chain